MTQATSTGRRALRDRPSNGARRAFLVLSAACLCGCSSGPPATPLPETISPVLRQLRTEAAALAPLVQTPWVRDFLAATADLPPIPSRVVYIDRTNDRALGERQAQELDPEALAGFERTVLDEAFYYFTNDGTPLAYARPLGLAAERGG